MHHGVKGMKWGVRKDRLRSTRMERRQVNIERRRAKALDRTTSARYTYKQRKLLSDDELRQRIKRLNMEKQLKDLAKGDGGRMISTGRDAAYSAMGKQGAKILLSSLGPEGQAAAAFIRPKK